MALNYNHLYYFHVAAIEGSVAAAAARLGVTAATVSEQLKTLERTLSRELFERTQTGLKLTDIGRITFEHTAPMFSLGERLTSRLGQTDEPEPTKLRVGITVAAARAMTSSFVAPLFSLGTLVPSIRTGESLELLRDLRGGLLDLVLCEDAPIERSLRGLEIVEVVRTPLVVIAAPGFSPAKDWSDAKFMHYRPTMAIHREIESYLATHELRPMFGGEADDALLLVEAARQPDHIAIVPRSLAVDAVAQGSIAIVQTVDLIAAVVHALFADTLAARRVVELLSTAERSAGAT